MYEGHAFFIKDIQKLARLYACGSCQVRFTKACNLQRHRKTCSNGQTKTIPPNEKVYLPLTDYEKSFYSKDKFSFSSISWLEQTSKALGCIFTTHSAVMAAKDGSKEHHLMGMNQNQRWCSSSTAAISTGAQKGPRLCEKQAPESLKNGSVSFRKRGNRCQKNGCVPIRTPSFTTSSHTKAKRSVSSPRGTWSTKTCTSRFR